VLQWGMTAPLPADAPRHRLLIWTLQRCGGTNLTRRLQAMRPPPALEHEPFNPDRVLGHVTRDWQAHGDAAALAAAMADAARTQVLIKHCVEMVPWEISAALLAATAHDGWRHLFLYRREPRDRLLSLAFARRTGVWAPGKLRDALDDPQAALAAPLPVDKLLERETLCAQRLQQAWGDLRARGVTPHAVAFEDVFAAPREAAAARLMVLLDALGDRRGAPADDRFVEEVLALGDQRTREHYAGFRGLQRLERGLQSVPRFTPD
jgi:hypothetical protein